MTATKTLNRTTLAGLLERRAELAEHRRVSGVGIFGEDMDETDAQMQRTFPHIDARFRGFITSGGGSEVDFHWEQRDVTLASTGSPRGRSFTECFMGAAVEAAPLLDVATVVTTDAGEVLPFSFVETQMAANGVTVDGATITGADPVFGGGDLTAYRYPQMFTASNEFVTDSTLDLEQFAAERIARSPPASSPTTSGAAQVAPLPRKDSSPVCPP